MSEIEASKHMSLVACIFFENVRRTYKCRKKELKNRKWLPLERGTALEKFHFITSHLVLLYLQSYIYVDLDEKKTWK